MPSRPDARAAQPADGDLWEAVAPVGGGVSEARNDADLWEASNGARSESEPKANVGRRPTPHRSHKASDASSPSPISQGRKASRKAGPQPEPALGSLAGHSSERELM